LGYVLVELVIRLPQVKRIFSAALCTAAVATGYVDHPAVVLVVRHVFGQGAGVGAQAKLLALLPPILPVLLAHGCQLGQSRLCLWTATLLLEGNGGICQELLVGGTAIVRGCSALVS